MVAAYIHGKLMKKRSMGFIEFETTAIQGYSSLAMFSTTGGKYDNHTALIVTNKGGGHGEIGMHLALALRAKGLAVQLVNDTAGKDISGSLPFSEYGQLVAAGVEVFYADLSQPGALEEATCPGLCRHYEWIFDNQNVIQKEVADLAASCGAFYTYISSGGMYIPGDKFPMPEANDAKGADKSKQKAHEEYVLSDAIRPKLSGCAFFRPQYIVGPYTNKRDYLDWFFDRLTRDLPVPLPAPGDQTTTVSDVRDVASMVASVVGKEDAVAEAEKATTHRPDVGPVFNCASDKAVSLKEIVYACGAACGKSREDCDKLIKYYDPAAAKDAPSGGKFPFRATNFNVGVEKAKAVLGWQSEFNDFGVVALGYYEGYKALGLDKENPKMDTAFDEYVLNASSVAMFSTTGGKYDNHTALIVTNKGGGHGEIGMHLALALRAKGLAVQLVNDTAGKDISGSLPFSEYGQLVAAGVEVFYADLSQPGALEEATCPGLCRHYEWIFDNQNVIQKEVADLAASCGAFYAYISSGGMYIPGDKFPMPEANDAKGADKSKQKAHEEYVLSDAIRPKLSGCAFFRPQYIVGPYTNKRDYLDWFFDRLTRDLPVPLPAPGDQTTTVSDVRDVASMVASVVGKEDAVAEAEKATTHRPDVGPVFNCASDKAVSLKEIVYACGAACGKSREDCDKLIKYYDPAAAKDAPSGGKFPFRATNFNVGVEKAKAVLGWQSEFNDFDVVALGYYEGYKALGLDKENPKMDTAFDEYVLNASSVAMFSTTGGKYDNHTALIVTNKGGGHGEIGMHLALALRAKGLAVQLVNDTAGKDISGSLPFSEYGQLVAAGVEVFYADLSQPGALEEATCPGLCRHYEWIFDNQNVIQKEVADLAASCGAFYTYISSGGMYIPGDKFPMPEANDAKGADKSKQKAHEEYVLSDAIRPKLSGCAFFRPQYIVGPYTNKRDYLDWFFDRLTRDLPVPLPAPGDQTTTVSDVRDVASMVASVVGKEDAVAEAEKATTHRPDVGPVFNCASDKAVSLKEIVYACGAACGKSREDCDKLIKYYDPAAAKDAPSGGKFPFRATNFNVGVEKAKAVLGWQSEFNDFDVVALGYYEGYKALGLDKENPKMDTAFDEYVLNASSVAMFSTTGGKYDNHTALIVTNKGGGHGEIGMHLALALRAKGLAVQLVNDTAGKDISGSLPFSEYGQLVAAGVEVFYADLSQPGALEEATCPGLCRHYEWIFDNQNVIQKEVADLAASCGAFYTYISSGGMYIPGDKFPMPEANDAKGADKSKQKAHEEYVLSDAIRPKLSGCAFFRPQYIVGPYTNKRDYLDWFFDRLTRDLPVPLPAPGDQTTTVSDVRDVASMVASVVGKEDAVAEAEKATTHRPDVGPVFNCASDKAVSLKEIVYACGAACGKSREDCDKLIKYYDPAAAKDAPSGGKFPFRATNFNVGVEKAKAVLGWQSEFNDFDVVALGYYEGYKALGLDKENPKMDTAFDEYVLNASSVAMFSTTGGKYDNHTALIVTNKGGGHGEIGMHLALALRAKGLAVQLVNDTAGKDISGSLPFSEYGQLVAAGVEVFYADLSQPGALEEATCPGLCRHYEWIFDNQNVIQKEVADLAASCGAFYAYISSGGMYIPGDKFPMPEANDAKGADKSKQKAHEEYVLSDAIRPKLSGCAFFRPQYIVGPYTNKRDYLDWFFDRLTRDLPVPLPAPGDQTTTVSDVRDVASMVASVVGKEDAVAEAEKATTHRPDVGPVFNCASDKAVSLKEIVYACGAACGKSREDCDKLIKYYDPAAAKDAPSGGKFPFRATNFNVGVEKAKAVLGWQSEFNDFDVVALGYYEGYKALGLDKENPKMDTAFDEYVLNL